MCGIAGILRRDGEPSPTAEELRPMLSALRHRGPDSEGIFLAEGLALGSRRLEVIDPEGGAQPVVRGGNALVTSGELYDYVEERERLAAGGVEFSTRSDTEVVFRLLEREGERGLLPHRGMYASAFWDGTDRELSLLRDPFGMKPLLLRGDGAAGEARFASELPALLAGVRDARIDRPALVERLAFQVPLDVGSTLVAGVSSVPRGRTHSLRPDRRYRRKPLPRETEDPGGDPVERLREELRRSVRVTTRSDVPLGVCLSGGLDSSLVAALAAAARDERLPAFVGYFEDGPAYDEREHARRAAAEAGLDLVEVPIRPRDLLDCLEDLAVRLEGPIAGPGSFPQYVVARAAAERVKVVLTGQGADELFGGYARQRLARLAARGELDPDRLPPGLEPYRPLALRLVAGSGVNDLAEHYFRMVYRGDGLDGLLGPALGSWEGWGRQGIARETMRGAFHDLAAESDERRMLRFEERYLLPALLHVEDRVTMAHSLESRAPLLTPGIRAIARHAPSSLVFEGDRMKALLRRAAEGLAPASALARRDKMGFPVPLAEWAAGPLREPLRERLEDGPLVAEGILDPAAPAKLLDGAGGHGRHLWFFLILSEWMRASGVRL